MSKKIHKTMPARRSIPAISLQGFRATRFRHKTEGRGGAVNNMAEHLQEADDLLDTDDGWDEMDC